MNKTIVSIYSFFLISFTVFSYIFVDPNLFYLRDIYTGWFHEYRSFVTPFYATFLILFFFFYVYFMRMAFQKKIKIAEITLLIALSCFLLLLSYPTMLSHDIFNYITTAKVTYFYQENPYVIMPTEFIGEPLLRFTHAANKIALYGPFWTFLTALPFFISAESFIAMLLSFKLLVGFFYIGLVHLLWKISKNVTTVTFFALNPLVLIETFMSGHNDVVMMFFALYGIYFALRRKHLLAISCILLSIMIKYATLFLLLVYFYVLLKHVKKQSIVDQKAYLLSAFAMMIIFILSPLRVEIYPWYAIWFLPFVILSGQKYLMIISFALSFSLMLRYIPFMLLQTHFGITPIIKIALTFLPTTLLTVPFLVYRKLWKSVFS